MMFHGFLPKPASAGALAAQVRHWRILAEASTLIIVLANILEESYFAVASS
jgi:hypothetical protein